MHFFSALSLHWRYLSHRKQLQSSQDTYQYTYKSGKDIYFIHLYIQCMIPIGSVPLRIHGAIHRHFELCFTRILHCLLVPWFKHFHLGKLQDGCKWMGGVQHKTPSASTPRRSIASGWPHKASFGDIQETAQETQLGPARNKMKSLRSCGREENCKKRSTSAQTV